MFKKVNKSYRPIYVIYPCSMYISLKITLSLSGAKAWRHCKDCKVVKYNAQKG